MLKMALLMLCLAALFIGIVSVAPYGIDWNRNLRPATRAFLRGENPYDIPEFLNPPWTLLLLAPFALLPEPLGRAALFVVSLALLAVVLKRYDATPLTAALFLSTPMALSMLQVGNLEAFVLFGLCLPLPFAALLLLVKPQVGLVPLAFMVWIHIRDAGWRRTFAALLPTTALLILSFVAYGNWPMQALTGLNNSGISSQIWPLGVPVGFLCAYTAFRERLPGLSLIASPLLSPHVSSHSWIGALLAAVRRADHMVIVWLGFWLVVLILAIPT